MEVVDKYLPRADQCEAFLVYWRTLQEACGGVPTRLSFNPMAIKDLLPFVFILERRSEKEIHVRLSGTALDRLSPATVTGSNYLDLCPPQDRDFFAEVFNNILDTPCGAFLRREVSFADGSNRQLTSKSLPLLDRNGEARYVIGAMTVRSDFLINANQPSDVTRSKTLDFNYLDLGYGLPSNHGGVATAGVA